MKRSGLAVCALLWASLAPGQGSGGVNLPSQRDKPHLILISIDGFRHDYIDLVDTPALDAIAGEGVRAEAMVPVYPTLTFPNHYSIATGLYPARHGLIGNTFPDPARDRWYSIGNRESVEDGSWYRGSPAWSVAEENGVVAAAFYFVGTEAAIGGVRPTYWKRFDASVPGAERVDQVLEWLGMPPETRPHFLTLYFEHVDSAAHDHGPESDQALRAVRQVDSWLARLRAGIAGLGLDDVHYVLVSDHGQARYDDEPPFIVETVANLDGVMAVDHGSVAFLYFRHADAPRADGIRDAINAAWEYGRAYLPADAPPGWHIPADAGFADVIVQADPGYAVLSRADRRVTSIGDHGWAPEAPAMHGIFLAAGPRLPQGVTIGKIDAVDVYPLLLAILGLPMPGAIDGDAALLPSLLAAAGPEFPDHRQAVVPR